MDKRRYIWFGFYSYEFGLYVASCVKTPPERQEQTETIPYHNGSLDLSYYYDTTCYYYDGQLIYTLERLVLDSEEYLYWQKRITTWLYNTPYKAELRDSAIPGYCMQAKCTALSFAKEGRKMTVTATFSVHPYLAQNCKQSELTFNSVDFETDYLNKLTFTPVAGATEETEHTETFDIYYPWSGQSELDVKNRPYTDATVTLNGKTVDFAKSDYKKGCFTLLPKRQNTLTITCKTADMDNTKVDFDFVRKEVF